MRRFFQRVTPHLILIAILVLVFLSVREWAYATTYRLFLDERVDNAARSEATQRFDLEGAHVVPLIAMRDDRVAFRTALTRGATIRAQIRPAGPARYEVRRKWDGRTDVLCAGDVSRDTKIACECPAGPGILEVETNGEASWADLRLERHLRLGPMLVGLGALFAVAGLPAHRRRQSRLALTARGKEAWASVVTMLVATVVGLLIVEGGLRLVGTRISEGLSAARHDLGEPTNDPRWQPSARYGQRLSPRFEAANVWRAGDIIRMGFLSPSLGDGIAHRFMFHTDEEGFRNLATRDRIDVAALGDSFTDALTMAADAGWPSQLEQRTGLIVQNYGTSGFGPQQELRVLEDFALGHHPRIVVLAFFAGNDIRDAEVFELTGGTHVSVDHAQLGWPIKRVVSRADGWFLTSAMRAAGAVLASEIHDRESPAPPAAAAVDHAGPRFDRGMFTVSVNGRPLRWAFMPPYLLMLTVPEQRLAQRRGWMLAMDAIRKMDVASRRAGARFVVTFLPSKSQVHLPLLARTFSEESLRAALAFSLRPFGMTSVDLQAMLRNRLALNALVRRFCADVRIPFLDTTEALRAHVEAGEAMYFPDDSHLNEAGEAVVADALAGFLREQGHGRAPDVR